MAKDIHPSVQKVECTCSCGNVVEIMSTIGKPSIAIDVCFKCHSFYTGQQKVMRTTQVDKFYEKYKISSES
jgi:large subunit ribosomal protein L31